MIFTVKDCGTVCLLKDGRPAMIIQVNGDTPPFDVMCQVSGELEARVISWEEFEKIAGIPVQINDREKVNRQALWSMVFIGGANDGKRMNVPNLPQIVLPLPEPVKAVRGLETEEYRRERIHTGKKVFEFYVSQSISIEEAIGFLLMNYKKET